MSEVVQQAFGNLRSIQNPIAETKHSLVSDEFISEEFGGYTSLGSSFAMIAVVFLWLKPVRFPSTAGCTASGSSVLSSDL
jgi:hypothetical protein